MYPDNRAVVSGMRVRIVFGRLPVCSPAGMAYANRALMPAESYPRYSSFERLSNNIGAACLSPM